MLPTRRLTQSLSRQAPSPTKRIGPPYPGPTSGGPPRPSQAERQGSTSAALLSICVGDQDIASSRGQCDTSAKRGLATRGRQKQYRLCSAWTSSTREARCCSPLPVHPTLRDDSTGAGRRAQVEPGAWAIVYRSTNRDCELVLSYRLPLDLTCPRPARTTDQTSAWTKQSGSSRPVWPLTAPRRRG